MLLGFGEAEDVRPWRRAMAASDSRTLEIPVDTPVLRAGCACSSPPARTSEPLRLPRRSFVSDGACLMLRPSCSASSLSATYAGEETL